MTVGWAEAGASPEGDPSYNIGITQAGHVGAGSQVQTSAQIARQVFSNYLFTNPDLTTLKRCHFKGKRWSVVLWEIEKEIPCTDSHSDKLMGNLK